MKEEYRGRKSSKGQKSHREPRSLRNSSKGQKSHRKPRSLRKSSKGQKSYRKQNMGVYKGNTYRSTIHDFSMRELPSGTNLYRSDDAFKTDGDERIRTNKPLFVFEDPISAAHYGTVKKYRLTRTLHFLSVTEANIKKVIERLKEKSQIEIQNKYISSDNAIRLILIYLSQGHKVDAIKQNSDELVWTDVKINTVMFPPSLREILSHYEDSLAHTVAYILCTFGIDGIHHPPGMERLQGNLFHEELLVCNPRDCVQRQEEDNSNDGVREMTSQFSNLNNPNNIEFTGTIIIANALGAFRITNVTLQSFEDAFITIIFDASNCDYEKKGNDNSLFVLRHDNTFEIHKTWLDNSVWFFNDEDDNIRLQKIIRSI